MNQNYVTKKQGATLSFPYGWHQTFDHPFEISRAVNEALTVKSFVAAVDERQMGLEILILLLDYTFATKDQMERLLKAKGVAGVENLDVLLDKYLAQRIINKFTLSAFEFDHIPDDAFVIYCLDHGSRHILSHFYHDDVAVTWRSTNAFRSAELVSKYLATNELYLSLLGAKGKNLASFQPTVNYTVRRRDIRLSAAFRIMRGSTPCDFIAEVVRHGDLPVQWKKKLDEQICPFIDEKFWNRYFVFEPVFILLAENLNQAEEVAQAYSLALKTDKFRVTTDIELLKGIDNATFYKYNINAAPSDTASRLIPVKATIFQKDQ